MTTLENPFSILNSSSTVQSDVKSSDQLGQDEFLELMLAQLENQDPMEPMENGEFLAQIAQFSTVTGIQDLQSSFDSFTGSIQSSMALQASSLVGRSVVVPSNQGLLSTTGGLTGSVDLPQSTSELDVRIYDVTGQLVKEIPLGANAAGQVQFNWNGISESGNQMPPGTYYISASALIDGTSQAQSTLFAAPVESVTLGAAGQEPIVNLAGIGAVAFSSVKEIM